jgi:hypothetical protein
VKLGDWTYYGSHQQLPGDVHDASADEAGNVYVAGGDAVYVKTRTAEQFLRFDSENAGLSKRCNDIKYLTDPVPAAPFQQCPVISVGGAAPGTALVGFDGFGYEGDGGAPWALTTGGADVVAFDAAAGKLTRTRHVLVAAPPHVICDYGHVEWTSTCVAPAATPGQPPPPAPWFWDHGRRLVRRIRRIVVNHMVGTDLYGDTWFGGNHGTLSVLLHDAARRGWVDTIEPGFDPYWADARDVWEHVHPAVTNPANPADIIVGEGYGVAIDPRNGQPYGSNGIRTTGLYGYPDLVHRQWGFSTNKLAVWPEAPLGDDIRSVTMCADGGLWVASTWHGLGRIDVDTMTVTDLVALPGNAGALTVACDPSDGSLWVGPTAGGLLRYRNGAFEKIDLSAGAPAFASQPVLNVQFDTWTTPRIAYFAFGPARDAATSQITSPGGVGAYAGR